jgi:hypothetical protein
MKNIAKVTKDPRVLAVLMAAAIGLSSASSYGSIRQYHRH